MLTATGAVIAAAGLGSRLGLGLPKCMLEIEGKTILSRMIETVSSHVSRIHVVVGYREELIIDHCAHHHRDVVIVRNPDFRTTNTAKSMALGAKGIPSKVVFMDGDLVISPLSFAGFMEKAAITPMLVGITPSTSEQAVFAETEDDGSDSKRLIRFTREARMQYEWANIVAGPPTLMDKVDGYVFEQLEAYLPLPAFVLDLSEVDTTEDLVRTNIFTRTLAGELPSG